MAGLKHYNLNNFAAQYETFCRIMVAMDAGGEVRIPCRRKSSLEPYLLNVIKCYCKNGYVIVHVCMAITHEDIREDAYPPAYDPSTGNYFYYISATGHAVNNPYEKYCGHRPHFTYDQFVDWTFGPRDIEMRLKQVVRDTPQHIMTRIDEVFPFPPERRDGKETAFKVNDISDAADTTTAHSDAADTTTAHSDAADSTATDSIATDPHAIACDEVTRGVVAAIKKGNLFPMDFASYLSSFESLIIYGSKDDAERRSEIFLDAFEKHVKGFDDMMLFIACSGHGGTKFMTCILKIIRQDEEIPFSEYDNYVKAFANFLDFCDPDVSMQAIRMLTADMEANGHILGVGSFIAAAAHYLAGAK